MGSGTIVLLEGILVLGGVLVFALWQLRSVRRPAAPPGHAERQQELHPGPGEAVEREGLVDGRQVAAEQAGGEQRAGVEGRVLEPAQDPHAGAGIGAGGAGEPPPRAR